MHPKPSSPTFNTSTKNSPLSTHNSYQYQTVHTSSPPKRSSPTDNTHYIKSLEDPYSNAMLSTLESPIRSQLHTHINIRGTNHAQIVYLQINSHTRNILGRTYHQLFLTPDTQELASHITPSAYNHVKDITG
jgi:hypothetical protein